MSKVDMTPDEQMDLVERVSDFVYKGVIKRPDAIAILEICTRAAQRRVDEIDRITKPSGPVQ